MQTPSSALRLRVADVVAESEDVRTVTLVAATDDALPAFTAGSHVELALPASGSQPLLRQYSLLNDPQERHRYVVGVGLHPQSRGGSQFVHRTLKVGEVLQASAPRNRFPLAESAEMTTFIAGGIGVTPLLSMASRLSHLGKPWRMYYCARTPSRAAYLDRLLALNGGEVVTVFDGCPGVRPLSIDDVVESLGPAEHLYCCGPAGMLAAFEHASRSRDPATVHVEWFEAPAPGSNVREEKGALTVRLARTGMTIAVPADRSILDAVQAAGIDVPNSCGDGICGSCETRVLRGRPMHRDHVLTAAERASGDRMMVCVSRALDPELTLDL